MLIAGSGGGGMVAGLAALDSGLEPLIVEKQSLVGGSTGLSGGIVWLPNNPLMRAEGVADSHQDGLAYLADVVGDIGAASSPSDVKCSSPRATKCSISSPAGASR
ncbi:FAD binding domain protein [Mycobacterium avium subsp. avium 2285 (R)]|nr:FAD binding domain protein [Mycobacterium avium subsp. avium 2285 (R)]